MMLILNPSIGTEHPIYEIPHTFTIPAQGVVRFVIAAPKRARTGIGWLIVLFLPQFSSIDIYIS